MFYPEKILCEDTKVKYYDMTLTVLKGFKYKPSIPIFYLRWKKVNEYEAYYLALVHDYVYFNKIDKWTKADNWLFKRVKLNFIERLIFRSFSWIYWIT